jgi:hypothetical protein
MHARVALLAACLLWLAYESHFSPSFFITTVQGSLGDILAGMDTAIRADYGVQVTAATE